MKKTLGFVRIPTELLKRFSEPIKDAQRDESAIPSYLHWNPFVRWIINKRLEVIVSFVEKVLSIPQIHPRPSALDLGCGVGLLIPSLFKHFSILYVTDHMMDGARLTANHFRAGNVEFIEPEAWQTIIPDRSLTVVIAADVLEHVEDLDGMVASIHRVLLPDGSLIVSGPTETFIYDLARKIAGFSGEYHTRTIFDIKYLIEKTGFRAISLKKLPFPIFPKLFRVTHYKKEGPVHSGENL